MLFIGKTLPFFSKTFFNSLPVQEMKPRGGVKSIVLLTVTMKTNYYICVFLLLRMDGLGDSTHKIVSKKTPKAGASCWFHWCPLKLQPGQAHPWENSRVTQVWGGKWEAWSWFTQWDGWYWCSGQRYLLAAPQPGMTEWEYWRWWRQMWCIIACALHRNGSHC